MRVLVVEDDVMLAKSLVGLLELSGAEIVHKADAASAKAALQEGGFGLVVSDYSLGAGENGDAVLKAAQALQPQAKRIMMSGSNSAEWVVEAGLAQAFYLKNSGLAEVLLSEAEALAKPAPSV
jgi:DNA-binding NtrC family response regulator